MTVADQLLHAPDARHWGYSLTKTTGLAPGALYPILARMEKRGWLTSDWDVSPEPGPRRRYYQLTDEGRTQLTELVEGAQR